MADIQLLGLALPVRSHRFLLGWVLHGPTQTAGGLWSCQSGAFLQLPTAPGRCLVNLWSTLATVGPGGNNLVQRSKATRPPQLCMEEAAGFSVVSLQVRNQTRSLLQRTEVVNSDVPVPSPTDLVFSNPSQGSAFPGASPSPTCALLHRRWQLMWRMPLRTDTTVRTPMGCT